MAATLDVACDAVIASWATTNALSAQTQDKFGQLARSFTRFAHAHEITTLDRVDHDLVARFVAGQSRSPSNAATLSATTMRNRRAAIRAFFRTAQALRFVSGDPTTAIAVPRNPTKPIPAVRPLSDIEAEQVRAWSQRATPTRHASTAALLLVGAHTVEAGHIRICDVDLATDSVWIHGSSKYRARTVTLDTWARCVLQRRIQNMAERGATADRTLCTKPDGTQSQRQTRICGTIGEILISTGLADDCAIAPSSLTAYAARRELDTTGRIENATRVIGFASLDAAAAFIGHHWDHAG